MKRLWLLVVLALLVFTACAPQPSASIESSSEEDTVEDQSLTLMIGAYSVVKDVLQELIPEFQRQWKEETGQTLRIQESYEASGTQARSIAGGMEADVALFSMQGDVETLVKSDLVDPEWKNRDEYAGMVTRSIVVIGTREGNPQGIRDWQDLTRSSVDVIYPNPKTSGGAQWDINAIYGAGLQIAKEQGLDGAAYAKQLLSDIHHQVISMDKSGRASMAAFEYGVGDAIVTYENELIARQKQGVAYELVVPKHTILIENPVVVVDRYADQHGTRKAAEAFVNYLRSETAQQIWMDAGFRSVLSNAGTESTDNGVFTVEDMGGWEHIRELLYSKRGIWYEVLAGL